MDMNNLSYNEELKCTFEKDSNETPNGGYGYGCESSFIWSPLTGTTSK